jgi:nitrous oxidase accessory protein NosD
MTKRRLGAVLAIAGVALAVAAVAPAREQRAHARDTIFVAAGQSIQQAIDRAHPGDTIVVAAGVYRENLTIMAKDDITLRGAGDTPGGSVLEPPVMPHPSVCSEFGEVNGICITGELDPVTHSNGAPITGTRVSGFLVRDFSRFGILLNNAIDTTVSGDEARHNQLWGIAGFILTGARYLNDLSDDNGQGGFYLADSPNANAVVVGNRGFRNSIEEGIGLFLRDASHGVVRDNEFRANCAGIWFLDGPLPGPASDWVARDNVVRNNTGACPPSEDIPVPLSGFGIALLGTDGVVVQGNLVTGNRPTGETAFAGGIVLASSAAFGGTDPTGNVVRQNQARNNDPADLLYDGSGSGNRFIRNDCGTSIPNGLCG